MQLLRWENKKQNGIADRSTEVAKGVFTWSDFSDTTALPDLTESERRNLKAKHKTQKVDYTRARMVKQLLSEGKTVRQIADLLRPLGRGYKLRTLTKDCAGLSPTVGEGLKRWKKRSS